jgi:hypothetical protein
VETKTIIDGMIVENPFFQRYADVPHGDAGVAGRLPFVFPGYFHHCFYRLKLPHHTTLRNTHRRRRETGRKAAATAV